MDWEYRKLGVKMGSSWDTTSQSAENGISELNRLGREGWEVARVIPLSEGHGLTHSIVFLLRREALKPAGSAGIATTYLGL